VNDVRARTASRDQALRAAQVDSLCSNKSKGLEFLPGF
jgi:hypothetical protein